MEHILKTGIAILTGLMLTATTWAQDYTTGTVRKIDENAGKVTVAHGPIDNLDMPAMTMVFRVADEAMLQQMNAGDDIEFVVERRNGKLTIIELKQ